MMKKTTYIPLILLCLLSQACTEFFSPDVSELKIEINSPKADLYTNQQDISFWWELDKSAEAYRYQLVTPNFDNPFLLVDTLLTDAILYYSLDEGLYTWRLRAENESSESEYIVRSIVIDTTAPALARATYPLVGDTLNYDLDLLELTWQSQDQPIDGIVHSVSDSVYLYEIRNGMAALRASYFVDHDDVKQISFSRDIDAPQRESQYRWEVKTFDQAGNRRTSGAFSFWIK